MIYDSTVPCEVLRYPQRMQWFKFVNVIVEQVGFESNHDVNNKDVVEHKLLQESVHVKLAKKEVVTFNGRIGELFEVHIVLPCQGLYSAKENQYVFTSGCVFC